MTTKPQHTPTPWKYQWDSARDVFKIHDQNGYNVMSQWDMCPYSKSELEANAAYICKAVNFHQVLLNIAKNLEYKRHGKPDSACEVCQTIAKAEGK